MKNLIDILILLLVASLATLSWAEPASDVRIEGLRCEYREEPLGIDMPDPRLSWRLVSDRFGAAQQAHQVLVASRADLLEPGKADLWDSGLIATDQSVQVPYRGKPLTSGARCFWRVRVRDDAGRLSDWSAPARWSMGVLRPEDWTARWIGLDEGPAPESLHPARWIWRAGGGPIAAMPVGACFFRRTFNAPENKRLISAVAWLAADNRMTVYLNGERCGASGDYHSASEFNLLNGIRPGGNVIAVEAENGGDGPNPAGLIGMVRMTCDDGSEVAIPTDNQWRVTSETQADWNKTGFEDSAWEAASDLGPYGMDPWGQLVTPDSRKLPARMLRRAFELEKPLKSAVIHMAGLGVSELHVNGRKVGDAVLSPALSDYDKRVYYVTQDVTQFLKEGANVLGVWLGNGRFYAPRDSSFVGMRSYGFPKLLLQMDIAFEDGDTRRIVTDGDWRITAEGPITANNEYDGERYDARLEMNDWSRAGFDDSHWRKASEVDAPKGKLCAEAIDPIRVTETLQPKSISSPEPGVALFDMGQNMVGWVRLKVRGARGAHVALRFAETLHDGRLFTDNLRGARCMDVYILKGEGEEVYEPRFTYHGFRYVELRGYPEEPDLSVLEGKVVHDALEPAGSFRCSDETINQVYRNAVWGTRGNYRSVPTDCPQRDERQGWLGDRSEESRGEMYLFDAARFYAKWVQDIEDTQLDSGSISDVAPPYYPFYTDNVTWPSSFLIIPGMLYEKSGDTRVIERHYAGMKRWIAYMRGFIQDGLMPRDQYGDWCVPPESQELIHSKDPARKTAGTLIATAYFCHDLDLMAGYASLLGHEEDAAEYRLPANDMRAAFNRKYWNEEKGQYDNGTQTTCVLALAFKMAPEGKQSVVLNHLIDSIRVSQKGHLATGLIGGQWLMRVLAENRQSDTAFIVATQREYPSWGYMIDHGATTIWELWNGDTADPGMNSHNHVMLLGDFIVWLHECLAGIQSDPGHPGFKKIVLKPSLAGNLTFVEASYNSMYGPIRSHWRRDQGDFSWDVAIPPNTFAEIHVPSADADTVMESGEPISPEKGIRFLRRENGASVYRASAGRYAFQSRLN
ncbi:MAG: family 78 glycoside hydrolase catalytic domain [Candidatus Omnitrophica bacterium]|nr:family 78 glycoside hydrolase catalytic domain [Candidatus Omnitrophota bacterium]